MSKTTEIMEYAVFLLGELPQGDKIFITNSHVKQLKKLELDFKNSGLVDVRFVFPSEILNGRLFCVSGVLLIDNPNDLRNFEYEFLRNEQRRLRNQQSFQIVDYLRGINQ